MFGVASVAYASGSSAGRKVGGIDFGFRNPFAAVWGTLDGDGVLWLTGEHYCRQRPLSYHAQHLPHDVVWYADPSGATERSELRCAGFTVHAGVNALRPGIAAVSAPGQRRAMATPVIREQPSVLLLLRMDGAADREDGAKRVGVRVRARVRE